MDRKLSITFFKTKFSNGAGLLGRLPSTIFAILFIFLCLSSQIQSTDLGYGIVVREKRILLSNDYPTYSKLSSAISWIKDNVPVETRILIQDTYGETLDNRTSIPVGGTTLREFLERSSQESHPFPVTSHAFGLTPMLSGVSILGSWCKTDYLANDFGVTENGRVFRVYVDQIQNVTEFNSFFVSAIRDLGVGFVLSHSENFTRVLQENKIWFEERYSDGVFHIFQLKMVSRIFVMDATGPQLEIVDFESNYLRLNVYNLTSTTDLQIKMIFYANWKCYVDGEEREIKIDYGTLGLPFMSISLKNGDSQIILQFEDTLVNLIGGIVSWTTALVVISIFVYYARRRMEIMKLKRNER